MVINVIQILSQMTASFEANMIKSAPMRTGRQNATKVYNGDIFPVGIIAKMMAQIAIVLGGILVLTALGGRWLDSRFATTPWLTVVLLLAAFSLGLIVVFRIAQKNILNSNEPKQC